MIGALCLLRVFSEPSGPLSEVAEAETDVWMRTEGAPRRIGFAPAFDEVSRRVFETGASSCYILDGDDSRTYAEKLIHGPTQKPLRSSCASVGFDPDHTPALDFTFQLLPPLEY